MRTFKLVLTLDSGDETGRPNFSWTRDDSNNADVEVNVVIIVMQHFSHKLAPQNFPLRFVVFF